MEEDRYEQGFEPLIDEAAVEKALTDEFALLFADLAKSSDYKGYFSNKVFDEVVDNTVKAHKKSALNDIKSDTLLLAKFLVSKKMSRKETSIAAENHSLITTNSHDEKINESHDKINKLEFNMVDTDKNPNEVQEKQIEEFVKISLHKFAKEYNQNLSEKVLKKSSGFKKGNTSKSLVALGKIPKEEMPQDLKKEFNDKLVENFTFQYMSNTFNMPYEELDNIIKDLTQKALKEFEHEVEKFVEKSGQENVFKADNIASGKKIIKDILKNETLQMLLRNINENKKDHPSTSQDKIVKQSLKDAYKNAEKKFEQSNGKRESFLNGVKRNSTVQTNSKIANNALGFMQRGIAKKYSTGIYNALHKSKFRSSIEESKSKGAKSEPKKGWIKTGKINLKEEKEIMAEKEKVVKETKTEVKNM